MKAHLPRLLALCSVAGASFVWMANDAHATAALLSYWNFNNVSPAFSTNLGSFSTTANVTYGEAYSQVDTSHSGTLASNTSNSTIFNGSAFKIDFSNIDTITGPTINGKKWSDHTNQEGTGGPAGYGIYADSTVNRAGSDSTTGGSLIFLNPGTALNGKYITFSFSSLGYNTLFLSYATRLSSVMSSGSEIWTYSTDGTNYSALATLTPTRNSTFVAQTLDLSTLSSNTLDNTSTFYLRMAFNSGSGNGSYSFDNFQLTGTAIPSMVPEPSTFALFGGLGVLCLAPLRRPRQNRRSATL